MSYVGGVFVLAEQQQGALHDAVHGGRRVLIAPNLGHQLAAHVQHVLVGRHPLQQIVVAVVRRIGLGVVRRIVA